TDFGLRGKYLEDVSTRQLWLQDIISLHAVQDNDPFCRTKLCNIKKKCAFIAKSNVSSDQEVMNVFARVGQPQEGPEALQDYKQYIASLREKSIILGKRFTEFQTCAQWVSFHSCNPGSKCPFIQDSAILEIKQKLCQDAFGLSEAKIKQRIAEKERDFGGRGLKKTNNIFVILGGLDPWKAAGEIVSSESGPTQYEVPQASHCYWLNAGATRLPGVREMLDETLEMVQSWLKAEYNNVSMLL
ncbi:Thymus-specific serine protease, partial [Perkinsus chesapeaki]